MNYTLKEIDDNLWCRVKIMVATERKTIKGLIVELLTKAVEQFEKKGR